MLMYNQKMQPNLFPIKEISQLGNNQNRMPKANQCFPGQQSQTATSKDIHFQYMVMFSPMVWENTANYLENSLIALIAETNKILVTCIT